MRRLLATVSSNCGSLTSALESASQLRLTRSQYVMALAVADAVAGFLLTRLVTKSSIPKLSLFKMTLGTSLTSFFSSLMRPR